MEASRDAGGTDNERHTLIVDADLEAFAHSEIGNDRVLLAQVDVLGLISRCTMPARSA